MDSKKAELLKHEADKIMGKLFYFGSNRFEDAAEKYNSAANLFRIKKDYDRAIECMKKELECYIKLDDKFQIVQVYTELANIYKNIDKEQCIQYYTKTVEYYMEMGKIDKLSKIYNEMANLYEELINLDKAAEYYKKAADLLYNDNQKMSSVKSYEKLADTFILLGKYKESIEILDNIIENIINDQRSYFLSKYIFKLLTCHMVLHSNENTMEDFVDQLDEIVNQHITFDNTSEHNLLESLAKAYLINRNDEYSRLLKDYDYYKKLDIIFVKLFSEIKNNLLNRNNFDDSDLT